MRKYQLLLKPFSSVVFKKLTAAKNEISSVTSGKKLLTSFSKTSYESFPDFKETLAFIIGIGMLSLYASAIDLQPHQCDTIPSQPKEKERKNCIFRREEVLKHNTIEKSVWVIYRNNVYDITSFIPNHPGGVDKISLAAGQDIEPFWNIYRQHYNSELPFEILQSLQIGSLHADDVITPSSLDKDADTNPYKNDPTLSPVMIIASKEPINAEPPTLLLTEEWITPVDLWFVRNHHPVVNTTEEAAENYNIRIRIESFNSSSNDGKMTDSDISLKNLKEAFEKKSVVSTIQCGGNRRAEMTVRQKTNGTSWQVSAIGNAKWSGVSLRDVLLTFGVTDESTMPGGIHSHLKHVQFISQDGLQASIPIRKALSLYGDVILAYEMNEEPIKPQHGYPLRAIVPGHVGVRQVKWLKEIILSPEEATGPWQRGMAYKGFGPSVKSLEGIDVEAIPRYFKENCMIELSSNKIM